MTPTDDWEAAHAAQDAEQERQRELNETIAANRKAERERWEASEESEVARSHTRAQALNPMPTLEALKELGSVVGDPGRGPAS
jgi:hypothetical protein